MLSSGQVLTAFGEVSCFHVKDRPVNTALRAGLVTDGHDRPIADLRDKRRPPLMHFYRAMLRKVVCLYARDVEVT